MTAKRVHEVVMRFGLLLVVSVWLAVALSACKGQASQVSFTAGDIPGDIPVPTYPGAVQTTESMEISLPDNMTPGVSTTERRRYLTDDSTDQVVEWYAQALPAAGFDYKGVQNSGAVFFLTGNWRYGLLVTTSESKTNIILAAGHE